MVWNVLWMAAMAAAAMLAGFCMGRLTMRNEVETAGEGAVQAYGVGWKREERPQNAEGGLNHSISGIRHAAQMTMETGYEPRQAQSVEHEERAEGQWTPDVDLGAEAGAEWSTETEHKSEDMNSWNSEMNDSRETRVSKRSNTFKAGSDHLRNRRTNRRSMGGEMWIMKAALAARTIVTESRQMPANPYGYGATQGRIDRSGRTSRGRHRGLSTMRFRHRGRESQESEGTSYSLGSPVPGYVMSFREGDRPAVVIQPMEDKLYAPAAGKITKLFPMGNDFLFVTEFGTELRIRAGDTDDDLLGRYFRPRVVQNEIVAKGKLLLEFDRQSLAAEGASTMVTLSVEHRAYGSNVRMTANEEVKAGEELLRVVERAESGNVRRE